MNLSNLASTFESIVNFYLKTLNKMHKSDLIDELYHNHCTSFKNVFFFSIMASKWAKIKLDKLTGIREGGSAATTSGTKRQG